MCNNIKADIVCFYIIETEDKRLGAIVFYIIIIVAIVNISKKNQKNNSTSQNQRAGTRISSAQPTMNNVQRTNPTPKTTAQVPTQKPVQPQQKVLANEPTTANVSGSTTEMLRKKAEEDQANHEKEKKLAEYKQKKSYMGKRYAQRYLLGDPVPKNMRVKCCGYCGAENLITYGSREQLLCYFCREDLK